MGCRIPLRKWLLRWGDNQHYLWNLIRSVKCTINIKLTLKASNTTKAEFANTVDPDNEPSHLDLQYLPFSLGFFNIMQLILKVFQNVADVILSSAFLALLYRLKLLENI